MADGETSAGRAPINNLVIVSDTHCGCSLGLCPPEGAPLDSGGVYQPSYFQRGVWAWWREFWDEFVPEATDKEPFAVCFNGDAIEGVHHNTTTPITHNLTKQRDIAQRVLAPVVAACEGRYYHIRGTSAHVGPEGCEEEALARSLGAIPNKIGQYARNELWKMIGPRLVHALHHISTTGSQAYESTAVQRELVESFTEAGRWGRRPPDVIVRSHRHRYIKTEIPTSNGTAFAFTTPAWQGKTELTFKVAGARVGEPQFGGVLVHWSEKRNELFIRRKVWSLEREEPE